MMVKFRHDTTAPVARLVARLDGAPVASSDGDVTTIEDPDDPRLEPYRAIRDRDLAELAGPAGPAGSAGQVGIPPRGGRFVAEGAVVLRALLSEKSRFRPESVLVAAGREGALPGLAPPGGIPCPIYRVARPVLDRLAGFPIHRGLLGIGLRGRGSEASDILIRPGPSLALGLVGLANHDNVGAVFRNAAAFGADAVVLDETTCDPLYRKAIRVSVGAALLVPFARSGPGHSVPDVLATAGYEVFALSPGGRDTVEEVLWPPRSALLLGPEGEGLPADILRGCRTLRIAMAPGFDSLNVATASGIALHAARTGRSAPGD